MIVHLHQLASPIVTTLRGPALALLRFNYHLARIPLQWAEWVVLSRLDEQASTRLAYEQLLIDCDRLAARLLDDEEAARRADDLDRHALLVRTVIAGTLTGPNAEGSCSSTNSGSASNTGSANASSRTRRYERVALIGLHPARRSRRIPPRGDVWLFPTGPRVRGFPPPARPARRASRQPCADRISSSSVHDTPRSTADAHPKCPGPSLTLLGALRELQGMAATTSVREDRSRSGTTTSNLATSCGHALDLCADHCWMRAPACER
ncbi:hypothetical protein RHA1_ro07013 [Rhodococcus jostii RHA1]|uniref:Uncharacterized protein n=1 Tax=Rhodococcus jostii (strain RHA1) TaxID=101510 RepID=Q0S107_RHOJR|nr:hypothetical protein RHA1_ro07013 [Rhodococcus jostii RHA1]